MYIWCLLCYAVLFFFNDTATTEIYTLSLHDALPISAGDHRAVVGRGLSGAFRLAQRGVRHHPEVAEIDRKSTRLNSSHQIISYAVFCLKKKNKRRDRTNRKTHKMIRQIPKSLTRTPR